ncbi:insulinase family protein [Pseudooceanicola sp. CBS1P-1]|uniref:Insulinase family protein n=1 Tax=Pseudooceanicola albus TaxID=2692189 RepID=A0A6L7G892_9RHOB|nr:MULTISPECIES: pitrilysin family protein [Pseudooceanicola]MBT9384153.1 insulinase family protein [Pseudooceanicola endophyticus]MXN19748.1 insulinase family protein [Pseudooceanicola albus]
MYLRLVAGALALAVVTGPARAADTADQVTDFKLDNGLEVVVIEDHRAPVVVQMVWYKVGAADEQPGVSGIAHFLEHLMFKGTDTMKAGEFSATVAANGGSDNAFTTQDYTAYFQRVAADRLPLMMKMESDRMTHLKLTPDVVDTERQVILEERAMRIDSNPQALFGEQLNAAQYLNSPYGIPVIGWRQEMEKLSLKEATDFYHKYYAPNDAVLVVAGDVTPDKVKELAQKYYGPIPANPDLGPRMRPQEPPQLAERRLTMRDARVAQPYVTRSYLAPERDAGDQQKAAALTLLSGLLGGTTGKLYEDLVVKQKLAVYASSYYSGTSYDDTTFGVYGVPAPGVTLEQLEAGIDKVLAQFLKDGVNQEDLDRLKMQIRAGQIYDRDDVDGLARMYGAALTSGLTVKDVQDWPEILDKTTPAQILAAAKEVLNRDHSVTGYLTPPDSDTGTDAPARVAAPTSGELTR